jgi:hypothetical protein
MTTAIEIEIVTRENEEATAEGEKATDEGKEASADNQRELQHEGKCL